MARRGYGGPVRFDALVLLGCRIGPCGRPSSTAACRADRAARAWHDDLAPLVVVSGGRSWHGVTEADALADYLVAFCGLPPGAILRESDSLSTRQNAWYTARLLKRGGWFADGRLGVVTSDWHMRRALGAFRHVGLRCEPLAAPSPPTRWSVRVYRMLREAASQQLDRWPSSGWSPP